MEQDVYVPLERAGEFYPGVLNGMGLRPPHKSTVLRHARQGINGIHLETFKIGKRRFTTRAALERFFDQLRDSRALASSGLAQQAEGLPETYVRPSDSAVQKQREARIEAAESMLARKLSQTRQKSIS